MIPQKIIDTAIRGGWKTPFDIPSKLLVFATLTHEEYCGIALDPEFWRSLGKALGWSEYGKHTMTGTNLRCLACGEKPHVVEICPKNRVCVWKANAFDFYDLILTGGDVQAFWDSLLTNPQP